ncbi:unnamed protein product [Cochlearia groenlandica]
MSMSSSSNSEERQCRICQSKVVESSYGIDLGCLCKDDLAFAHLKCAETWFQLKGDEVCEICRSLARNIAGGNEMIEVVVEEEGGGGGDFTVVEEDRESWWKRRLVFIVVLICWVPPFIIYFLQSYF